MIKDSRDKFLIQLRKKKNEKTLSKKRQRIIKMIKEKPGLSEKAYMGLVMKEFRGKVTGKKAMEIISRNMS